MLKRLLRALIVAVLLLALIVSMRTPSSDREWDEDVRILADINIAADDTVTFTKLRDWRYVTGTVIEKSYTDAIVDPNDIVAMWLYEQTLDASGLAAHTFIVFEFAQGTANQRYLGLSVEARREQGEQYSVLGGAFRAFEIAHIWATENDLVTRRVQYLDYDLTRYRLDIPREYYAQVFLKFAQESQRLATEPQWYNTLTNNCTSSLIKYVNDSEPGAIPYHYSYSVTGKVDEYLESLGYKDPDYAKLITRQFLKTNPLR